MKLLRSFPSISFVQTIGALGLKVPLLLVSVVALAVLAGCGGGDSGSQPSSDDEAFPSSSTLSPLDNPISFLSSSAGEQDIYVVDADGEGLKRLTTDPKSDLEPVWSPDGRSIAFISLRDRNAEIYVMEADGTGLTRLTDTSGKDLCCPTWSPNGSFIAFHTFKPPSSMAPLYVPSQTCVVKADGTGLTCAPGGRQTGSAQGPAWSPDSRAIAFYSNQDGNWEIYAMKADGTGLTNLTNTPEAEFNPTWSSDSRLIAYQAHRDGGSEVYVMEADGSGPTNLTNSPGNDDNPEWSPNGKAIAFDSFRAGHLEICFMGADGTASDAITPTQIPSVVGVATPSFGPPIAGSSHSNPAREST